MGTAGYSDVMWIGGTLITVFSLIAAICGVLALYLIHRVNRWNGYLLLVYTITVYQIVYDISYFFLPGFYIPLVYDIYTILNVISGTAVTLWVNVVSCVLLYTVIELESFDVKYYYHYIGSVIFFLSTCLSIVTVYWYHAFPNDSLMDWVYFWVRVGSIIANVMVYIFVALKLQGVSIWVRRLWRRIWTCICPVHLLYGFHASPRSKHKSSSSSNNGVLSICCRPPGKLARKTMQATNALLLLLVTRLKYYPAVQIITRAAATWWDVRYGFSSSSWSGSYDTEKKISQFLYDVTNPMAGVGFFLVLLYVQPSVYKEFYKLLAASPYVPRLFMRLLSKPETAVSSLAKSHSKRRPHGSGSSTHSNSSSRSSNSPTRSPLLTLKQQQLRLHSKSSSDASSRKGSEYDIQRDSNGIIIAIDEKTAVVSSSQSIAIQNDQHMSMGRKTSGSVSSSVAGTVGSQGRNSRFSFLSVSLPAIRSSSSSLLSGRSSASSTTANAINSNNHHIGIVMNSNTTATVNVRKPSQDVSVATSASSTSSSSSVLLHHQRHQLRNNDSSTSSAASPLEDNAAVVYSPHHTNSSSNNHSHMHKSGNTANSHADTTNQQQQQQQQDHHQAAASPHHPQQQPQPQPQLSQSTTASHKGSQHQLQALQQVAPVGWLSDNTQSITDYLLADDEEEEGEEAGDVQAQQTQQRIKASSKKRSSNNNRGATSTKKKHSDSNSRNNNRLSVSLPKNMRLSGTSTTISSTTTSASRNPHREEAKEFRESGDEVEEREDIDDRASGASSVPSSGVLHISHHPDDELLATQEHSDAEEDMEYENEGGGEEEGEEAEILYEDVADTDNSSGNITSDSISQQDIEQGNHTMTDDDNDTLTYVEQEDIDVDLDEDVVWEEIRRRIGQLRSAYQQILVSNQQAGTVTTNKRGRPL